MKIYLVSYVDTIRVEAENAEEAEEKADEFLGPAALIQEVEEFKE